MTFTEEDAQNDGKIVREVGDKLVGVLSRESPKLFDHFQQWCSENERDASTVLGNLVLDLIENEGYADRVRSQTVNLSELNTGDTRMEDLKFVKETIDMFEEDTTEDTGLDIDKIVEQRIESIGSGPLGGFQQDNGGSSMSGGGSDLEQKMDELIETLNSGTQPNSAGSPSPNNETIEDNTDDEIDSMFESSDDEQEEEGTFDSSEAQIGDGDSDDHFSMSASGVDNEPEEEPEDTAEAE